MKCHDQRGAKRPMEQHLEYNTSLTAAICLCVVCHAALSLAQPQHQTRREEIEEIVVTLPHGHRRSEIVAGTTILSNEEVNQSAATTIGDTLANQPGISSTGHGAGAGRPVIRGLGGQRVRVLQNRIDSLDLSITSPDHAVTVEPLLADRVEVIRGAGTLIYGSAAVGGVVNVEDGRIPSELPGQDRDDSGAAYDAAVRVLYGTNAEEKNAAARMTAELPFTVGPGSFAINAQGFFRDTNDFTVPGFVRSRRLRELEPEAEEARDDVANSDVDVRGGAVGTSYIWDDGHFGVAFGVRDDEYGVPGSAHGHADEEGEGAEEESERIRIDAEQWRLEVRGELRRDMFLFDTARTRFAYADYEHVELEGEAIGTRFDRSGWEGRVEFLQAPLQGRLSGLAGVVGVQLSDGDFSAKGDEAFVPPSDTFRASLFVVEEYEFGPFALEGGVRYEHQESKATALGKTRAFKRSLDGISFSLGGKWEFLEDYLVGATFGRTERLPAPEELFSNGPHLATLSFTKGDPDLDRETALSVEATLRKNYGRLRGDLNLFYYRYDDFIFEQNSGEVEDGLDVFAFRQEDAELYGGEFVASADLLQHRLFNTEADFQIDYVHAELIDNDQPLPRIPPLRMALGLETNSEQLHGRIEVQWFDRQGRISTFELPTDDYFRLNLGLAWHPLPQAHDLTLRLDVRNLTDAKGRNHVSFLKDRVPLPGRDVRLSLQWVL